MYDFSESIALENYEDFIKIMDGKRPNYGGNQKWFSNEKYRKAGCGAVAVSNITAYFGRQLYNYENLDKGNFIKHMEEVVDYVSPIEKIGIINPRDLIKGTIGFAESKGVILKEHWTGLQVSYDKICNFIKEGLRGNTPIALLMHRNSKLKEFDWHWMTITKYYENDFDVYLNISTWGERRLIKLKDFYKDSSYGALIYFTEKQNG
ncbi:hypothetical protein ACQPU1_06095 [Clostridium paraputrificum]|uniref:hypothetical protein n=1 Tax=Clostridium paraputrificum TaxID=29363 RepID=UPI003D353763